MQGEQMEQALQHDDANRKANGTGQAGPTLVDHADEVGGATERDPRTVEVEIGFHTVINAMDQKNAMLAKSVSMALVDVARAFTALCTQGRDGKAPDPSMAEKCLVAAEHALKLAEIADRLGDKSMARADIVAPVESVA